MLECSAGEFSSNILPWIFFFQKFFLCRNIPKGQFCFSLQNRLNFLRFQASGGECEASAERGARDRAPRASRSPSCSPAKRKTITPVLQASSVLFHRRVVLEWKVPRPEFFCT